MRALNNKMENLITLFYFRKLECCTFQYLYLWLSSSKAMISSAESQRQTYIPNINRPTYLLIDTLCKLIHYCTLKLCFDLIVKSKIIKLQMVRYVLIIQTSLLLSSPQCTTALSSLLFKTFSLITVNNCTVSK